PERLQPNVLACRVRLAPRGVPAWRDHARLLHARQSGVREAGAPDPRDEGRSRKARRDRQSRRHRGGGGVRSRGPPSQSQAEQGARRDALYVQGVNEPNPQEPSGKDPPGLARQFGDVRYSRWDGTQRLDALEADELLG